MKIATLIALGAACVAAPAQAQRTSENAVASAEDAFGGSVGLESTGIYNEQDVRGFSPLKAGNVRVDGVYFDQLAFPNGRIRGGSAIRVGFAALDYPFPAPTGIVDQHFRVAGDTAALSAALSLTQYGGSIEELDGQIPLIKDHLSLGGGIGHGDSRYPDGTSQSNSAIAVRAHIRFAGFDIQPFYGITLTRKSQTRPLITTAGPFLPPMIARKPYLGQDWADGSFDSANFGTTLKVQISPSLSLRAGAFNSRFTKRRNFTEIFGVATAAGLASHRLLADPRTDSYSNSWEGLLGWKGSTGGWQHRVLIGARGRFRHTETGGSDVRNFGIVQLGVPDPEPLPVFAFGLVNLGTLKQSALMAGYFGKLAGVGQINLGVQKADYRARFHNAAGTTISTAKPWLFNANLAVEPTAWLSLYGGYVRGLEDSGTAPENAANRSEQLPATLTRQIDGGIRFKIGSGRLVASLFDIRKPYFTFDGANRFVELGQVEHKGAEFSWSGPVTKRLQVLAGAVVMKPRVTGAARALGLVGERPVGTPSLNIRIDANYRTDLFGGLTPTLSLVHIGPRAGSSAPYAALGGSQVMLPAHTTIDLGLRQRLKIGTIPASLRLTVQNIFDQQAWKVLASNTYQRDDGRRLQLFLAADF